MHPVHEIDGKGRLDTPPTPRNIWKAISRGMDIDAKKRATAKLQTIPMFDIVRNSPELMPYAPGGALAITALVLAGKNILLPAPLRMDPKTTSATDVLMSSTEKTNIPNNCSTRPSDAMILAPWLSDNLPAKGAISPPRI